MPSISRTTFVRAAGAFSLAAATTRGASAAVQPVNNVLIESDGWLLPAWQSLSETDEAGTKTSLDLVAEAVKMLAAAGIGVLVVSLPYKARYCPALAPGSLSDAVMSRYGRQQEAIAARGLQTVDLDAPLRALQSSGQPIYYHTDQHWTTPAAEAAGTTIAAALQQHWKLPALGTNAKPSPLIADKRFGDLAALLPDADRAKIGMETFELRTAYNADMDGYDLYTGQTQPIPAQGLVQVVGTSFVRPMWGLPQKLTSILGPDVGVTFFTGDAGPYHTLLMNLRSSLPKGKPTVIVWQLSEATLHLGPAAAGSWSISSLMSADFFLSKVQAALN